MHSCDTCENEDPTDIRINIKVHYCPDLSPIGHFHPTMEAITDVILKMPGVISVEHEVAELTALGWGEVTAVGERGLSVTR